MDNATQKIHNQKFEKVMPHFPVQQWVDNIPPAQQNHHKESIYDPNTKSARRFLSRDRSFQSDDGSSYCSSVESFLEMRKPDPEEMLLGLGFGPKPGSEGASRIPSRFLKPSKLLPNIDFNKFLEEYGAKLPEYQFQSRSCQSSPLKTKHPTNF